MQKFSAWCLNTCNSIYNYMYTTLQWV